jgi:hypothetical protein
MVACYSENPHASNNNITKKYDFWDLLHADLRIS